MSERSINLELAEWETADPESRTELAGLHLSDDPAALVKNSAFDKRIRVTELRSGLSIETTSFVGRISLDRLNITIRPKIDGLPLWRLLRYAYGLRKLTRYEPVGFGAMHAGFQDLLIAQLLAEASEIFARGLQRRYSRRTESLSSPRGRIELSELARQAGRSPSTLPCTHFPKIEDNLLNQVLLAGLRFASGLTREQPLIFGLHRHIQFLSESVASIRLEHHLFPRAWAACNRLTLAYEPAIRIIQLLVDGSGINFQEHEDTIQTGGFLFDMNLFFQALVTRLLSDYLPAPEYRIESSYPKNMAYEPGFNPLNRKDPSLRPDIVVKRNATVEAVLDAKYRDLWVNALPPQMLYQLVIYALTQSRGREAIILYPTLNSLATDQRIAASDFSGDHVATVILRAANLKEL